ncbi:MAG: EAL domain-containing protein [Rubrivivax sp.]|jgi:diguanylate cyclase (GGDEF)-like protein/PAS domain S-box-containing protein|nr:EAL domain-containing protein [Rubrivivax sp.]
MIRRLRDGWQALAGADAAGDGPRPASGAAQLLHIFEKSDFGLLVCDGGGRVRLCSGTAAAMFGAPAEGIVGLPVGDWLAPREGTPGPSVEGFTPGQWETSARRRDGGAFPVELTVSRTELDQAPALIIIVRDITDRRLAQERLTYLANYDGLTGLPNRTLFRDRLDKAMARARRAGRSLALMFIDLDQFKDINDSLGHDMGDQLLRHVAETLRVSLRAGDAVGVRDADDRITVSRLGGDEFTVIAEQVGGVEGADALARRILEAIERPWRLLGTEVHISGSIGVTLYPDDDSDLDGLVRHTDMAMYRAKAMGRGVHCFYDAQMSAEIAARLALEQALRHALERREFALHYQPKAALPGGEITGVEALLRWHQPGRGMVPTGRFIDALENSALILPVGAWILRTACETLAAWDAAGLPALGLAVNISARQFRQPYLGQYIVDTLRETGIAPHRLELELTERAVADDHAANGGAMSTLKAVGVRIAMDDFGTGVSSLSYLKRLDIDTLKIDRSFVCELPHHDEDCAIAAAIVAMGHSLQMKVVAEGVETDEQAAFLESLGCDEIQGYLVSRPMAAEAFANWLAGRSAVPAPLASGRRYSETSPMTLISLDVPPA